MFVCEISIVILICQKLESVGFVQQKIKLISPSVFKQCLHHHIMAIMGRLRFLKIRCVLILELVHSYQLFQFA